jgi:cytochrome b
VGKRSWRLRFRLSDLVKGAHPPGTRKDTVRVWDFGVRAFHWLLVASVIVAAWTGIVLGRTTLAWHLGAGVTVAVLLVWRVAWGLLGTSYARFASFSYSPRAIVEHVRGIFIRCHRRHLGHNPLGALMVFAFFAVLATIVVTGTVTLGGRLKQGPLKAFLSYAAGENTLGVHRVLAYFVLGMVVAHLLGVAFESWHRRENLVRAMVTGDKPREPAADAAPTARAWPWLTAAIVLGVLAVGTVGVRMLAARAGRGVPPATLDPVFDEQCGACHIPYSPSLAPASTWEGILHYLKHHFGADATLTPDMVKHLRAYLGANDAWHWDTLPSHLFRVPAAEGSLRITETAGWQRVHRDIPARVFASTAVRRKSACEACHADAVSGMFAPQGIAIPSQAR